MARKRNHMKLPHEVRLFVRFYGSPDSPVDLSTAAELKRRREEDGCQDMNMDFLQWNDYIFTTELTNKFLGLTLTSIAPFSLLL